MRELRGGLVAGWPLDPVGGGTWVGASSRGLCVSLLNVNLVDERGSGAGDGGGVGGGRDGMVSRGLLIPSLIDSVSAGAVLERLDRSDLERFMPFRIVAADSAEVVEYRWDGRAATGASWELGARCFVSSGLGDERAAPRLELWEGWIGEHGVSPEAQDAFHGHRWEDRPEISVWMERDDARTVSVTTLEAGGDGSVRVAHRDDGGVHEVSVAGVVVTRATTFVSRRSGETA